MKNREDLIAEMAVALCSLSYLDDEALCVLTLMQHGFRAAEIATHLDEALVRAQRGWIEYIP